jgi:hypothetical protein
MDSLSECIGLRMTICDKPGCYDHRRDKKIESNAFLIRRSPIDNV